MENGPFIDDFPIKTPIYKGFSMAMLNNQMVLITVFPMMVNNQLVHHFLWLSHGSLNRTIPMFFPFSHGFSHGFPMVFPLKSTFFHGINGYPPGVDRCFRARGCEPDPVQRLAAASQAQKWLINIAYVYIMDIYGPYIDI